MSRPLLELLYSVCPECSGQTLVLALIVYNALSKLDLWLNSSPEYHHKPDMQLQVAEDNSLAAFVDNPQGRYVPSNVSVAGPLSWWNTCFWFTWNALLMLGRSLWVVITTVCYIVYHCGAFLLRRWYANATLRDHNSAYYLLHLLEMGPRSSLVHSLARGRPLVQMKILRYGESDEYGGYYEYYECGRYM